MTGGWAFAAGLAIAAAVSTGVEGRQDQAQPTFRGGVDLVSVDVSVRDHGRPVAGLQPADFVVRDNGVPQEIIDVSYEKLPIDVTVVLDVSESVTGQVLDQMRRAVGQLSADLSRADRIKVLTFNNRIQRVLDFTDDRASSDAALARVRAGGSTSLLDALAVALVAPTQPDRRQLVIVFSDGLDTSSVTDRPTMLELAARSSATATFVLPALGAPAGSPSRAAYEQLALETGGLVVSIQPKDDLGPTFTQILTDFRSSYVLHFTPKGVGPGGVHALEVRVSRRGADVRARRGYAWR